jgi:cardiolipin synthase
VLNIPNTLTLLRIAAIPAILIAMEQGQFVLSLVLFVAAGVTDALDGGIARLMNTRTTLGAYLDPLADKGLVLSLLIQLTVLGRVPGWVLTIILTRDVVCITGYMLLFFLTGEQIEIQPTLIGKLATCLQLGGLAATLLALCDSSIAPYLNGEAIFIGAAAATAISGVQYVGRGLRWYQTRPSPGPGATAR